MSVSEEKWKNKDSVNENLNWESLVVSKICLLKVKKVYKSNSNKNKQTKPRKKRR